MFKTVFLFFFLIPQLIFGQKKHTYYPHDFRRKKNYVFESSPIAYGGLSLGQETFISTPRGGILGEIVLVRKNRRGRLWNFHPVSVYGGAEGSLFGVFAFGGSAAVVSGLKLSIFTLDINAAVSGFAVNEAKIGYSTYNPKVGLIIGPVWLKCGPSYRFNSNKEPVFDGFMSTNNQAYNIEMLICLKL
jgi:hypothetical protein